MSQYQVEARTPCRIHTSSIRNLSLASSLLHTDWALILSIGRMMRPVLDMHCDLPFYFFMSPDFRREWLVLLHAFYALTVILIPQLPIPFRTRRHSVNLTCADKLAQCTKIPNNANPVTSTSMSSFAETLRLLR